MQKTRSVDANSPKKTPNTPTREPPPHLLLRSSLGEQTDGDADDENDEGEDDSEMQEVDLVQDLRSFFLLSTGRLAVVQVHDHACASHRQARHQAPERPLQSQVSQLISQPVS